MKTCIRKQIPNVKTPVTLQAGPVGGTTLRRHTTKDWLQVWPRAVVRGQLEVRVLVARAQGTAQPRLVGRDSGCEGNTRPVWKLWTGAWGHSQQPHYLQRRLQGAELNTHPAQQPGEARGRPAGAEGTTTPTRRAQKEDGCCLTSPASPLPESAAAGHI